MAAHAAHQLAHHGLGLGAEDGQHQQLRLGQGLRSCVALRQAALPRSQLAPLRVGGQGPVRAADHVAAQRLAVRHHGGCQGIDLPARAHAVDAQGARGQGRGRRRMAFAQFLDQGIHAAGQAQPVFGRGRFQVLLRGQAQCGDGHLVIETGHRCRAFLRRGPRRQPCVHQFMRQRDRVFHVVGQQALVQALGRPQHGRAAQQHLHELQRRNVAPQHQQADRERGGQDQPYRPPQRRPEGGRHDDGQRGQSRAAAIQPGLDQVVADQLQRHDQAQRHQQHLPARVHGKGQRQREGGRDHGPHIGHETHDGRQHAPENGARHANEPQPRRHGQPVGDVDDELHAQVLAYALRGLVQRVGGHVQVAAHQAQQPVTQVIAVQQDEDHEQQHDAGRGHGLGHAAQPLQHARRGLLLGRLDLHLLHAGRGGAARYLALHGVIGAQRAVPGTGHVGVPAQAAQLVADGVLVGGQIGAELLHLAAQIGTHSRQRRQRHDDHQQRGRHARHAPALEPGDGRIQQKAEQQRQRQRNQQALAEIQAGDDDAGHQQPGEQAQRGHHVGQLGQARQGRTHAAREIGTGGGMGGGIRGCIGSTGAFGGCRKGLP